MNLDEMNLQQVEERLAALDVEVREATEAEAVEKAAEEKKGLLTRKAELIDLEQRKKTALELNEGKAPEKIIEARKEEKKMEVEKMLDHSSEEYRSAWLKNLQGKELNEVEKRALTGGTSALPEATANKVVEILVDTVPLLNEIELFRMPGSINIAVEVTAPGATELFFGKRCDDLAPLEGEFSDVVVTGLEKPAAAKPARKAAEKQASKAAEGKPAARRRSAAKPAADESGSEN